MVRKVIAFWLSLAMVISFIVVLDVITDFTPTVGAATLYVNTTGLGGAYTSIQDAINASNDGDTVFVYSGTYYENLVVNKTINLTGEDQNTTIIDGEWNKNVLRVIADYFNITGFSIANSGPNIYDGGVIIAGNFCNIHENNVSGNEFGLYIYTSYENNITNNNLSNNQIGIYLVNSDRNNITDNEISSNIFGGIYLFNSTNNTIKNNNIISNDHGIYLDNSKNNNIIGNDFTDDGVSILGNELSEYNSHIIPTNNIVNKKPLYYYRNINNININAVPVGQLIFANCSDINVRNIEINNIEVGILVAYSTKAVFSLNNVSSNKYFGLDFRYSSNLYVSNNSIMNNGVGITFYSSSNGVIKNNNVSYSNGEGIVLYAQSNENIVISNNVTSSQIYGIRLYGSSNNNTIINNNISFTDYCGVAFANYASYNYIGNNEITNNKDGIHFFSGNNNSVFGNDISSNTDGIHLGTSLNQILNNSICNNSRGISVIWEKNLLANNNISNNDYGIELYPGASNNSIYHNNFINNTIQANDNGTDNYWDNGYPSGGNYWSDYVGNDSFKGPKQNIQGSDGIGDTPYVIDSDSQDNYPLMKSFTNISFEDYTILKQGWNLISIPIIQVEQNLTRVLGSIDGWYDAVQWYDITDPNDPWKHYEVGKPFGNDLDKINETMGFWIHITRPGDTIFLYNGTEPVTNQSIALHPGWNLVGYPSLTSYNRTKGLNNIVFGSDVDSIWTYNAATQEWQKITDTDHFITGKGYWVHSRVHKTWEVPL